ncbi:unnamed protein product [Microthlaspi erraticum]|uniref:Uncharacterized protein n=1 Tax=Microthlaspi erraticum TaxID=1685480 RepID=A0A6D2KFJ3_9BRAS|nr:unnamed protein product [Microthlaspi erraticum]
MEMVEGKMEISEEECTTPRSRIPVASVCPPPPRKKSKVVRRDPPINGYFQPPDLESLFYAQPRREAVSNLEFPRVFLWVVFPFLVDLIPLMGETEPLLSLSD